MKDRKIDPTKTEKGIHLEDIIETLHKHYPDADADPIRRAYAFASQAHAGQVRLSGQPYLSHPMNVALILARLKMLPPVIAASLIHDTLEDTGATAETLEETFGKEITRLVEGVTKLSMIRTSSREERQASNVRKMIMAMSDDIRVLLIKLADRLHNMRTLDYLEPDRKRAIAEETIDIYAPLANRLGIHWIKNELEDLSFKYLHPLEYKRLSRLMKERKEDLDKFILTIVNQTRDILMKERISAEVSGRHKHIYGIHKKMRQQLLDFDQLFDIIGVRIIANSNEDCYRALGLIHENYKPVLGKFKDYIALPKENGYQSLHTAVLSPTGKRMEFQIRTQQMHRISEEGIAAHWRYKEGGSVKPGKQDDHFIWLRRLQDIDHTADSSREFLENLKMDLFPDEVYVFTPDQEVMAFSSGATALDFAYAIHTQVGHRCVGVKINAESVPISSKLRNGDIVEILTSENQRPGKSWLKIAKTSHAKSLIRSYIRNAQREEALRLGRELVEEELKKYGLDCKRYCTNLSLEKAAEAMGFKNSEILLERIGSSKLPVYHFLQKLLPPEEWKKIQDASKSSLKNLFFKLIRRRKVAQNIGVKVGSTDNMLIRFAGCCNPVPGDAIIGNISKGHGIVIHNKSCSLIKEMASDPEKFVEAQWERPEKKQLHPVRIVAHAVNRPGILAKVSAAIAESQANINNAVVQVTDLHHGELNLTIEIEDLEHLERVMDAVRNVDGVRRVERGLDAGRPAKK
ncbi:MAG: bifunctional (p)ppGpp synthetase/guanosine-3',5'-bis(diphosphate) 3'-pyrophosphohydrolase [Nitrospinota bacterium]